MDYKIINKPLNSNKSLNSDKIQSTSPYEPKLSSRMYFLLTVTFVVYIGTLFILHLLTPDKDFSELENRNLVLLPKFNFTEFVDKSWSTKFEDYVTDQFPFRNSFISLKSSCERAVGKTENNGVFIGKNGYFLQPFNEPDMELAKRNAGYINTLAEDENLNVYTLIVPTSTEILFDKLPKYAETYSESEFIVNFNNELSDNVNKVPIMGPLTSNKNEYIYYKTDHHWTTYGAFLAYQSFCQEKDQDIPALEDYIREPITTEFYGSLFSKGNFSYATPDTIETFHLQADIPLTTNYVYEETLTDSLYNYEWLSAKDKYATFLDGNHALIKINTETKNGKKLLIIKDSYANCFVPFLTKDYEEIHIIDLRLATYPIKTYISENGIEDVLLLYNVHNFSSEAKLSLLTR